jgi:transcription antitermination factor NusG
VESAKQAEQVALQKAVAMPDEEVQQLPSWFALTVKPRFEKAVARTLASKGYETLLLVYQKQHQEGTRSRDSELPLFPGYVCCRFDVRYRTPILMTPGVIQVFGAGNMPIPLPDVEVTSLQTAIRARLPLQPFPYVQVGQRVRIERGALAGVEGIVMSFKQTLRLVLSITLLQRSVLLEVGRDQVTGPDHSDVTPYELAKGA